MRRGEIKIGQRYKPSQSDFVLAWEVIEIRFGVGDEQNVRLVKVGDRTTLKTLNVSALRDRRLYRLIPDHKS